MIAKLKRELRQLAAIDVRSLAAFRVGLASLLIADLLMRARDLRAHYCDEGVLPRSAMIDLYDNNAHFSIHLMSGDWHFQAALFAIAGLFALLMLVGYQTRLVTIVSWVLLISLQNRNTLILNGGDTLLRLLLFWSMLLPLGAHWSLDQTQRAIRLALPKKWIGPKQIISVPSFALMMQVALMYWFAALLKRHPDWTQDGTALYYAMNVDQIATPLGRSLLNYPAQLRILTFVTFYIEGFGPFLFFLPFVTPWGRMLGVAVFFFLHIGIYLTTAVGLFPWVCWVALLPFLPGQFWDALASKFRTSSIAQSLADKWGWFAGNAVWMCFSLVACRVETRSSSCTSQGDGSIAEPMISEIRMTEGPRYACWATNGIAAVLLVLVILWNVRTLRSERFAVWIPNYANQAMRLACLGQHWNMFAPSPMRSDGWFVIPGELDDGSEIDVYTLGGPVTDEKPTSVLSGYPNARWRKYMGHLCNRSHSQARLYYGRYLMRKWNREHRDDPGRQLERFKIYFWEECTEPSGPPRLRKVLLWSHYRNSETKELQGLTSGDVSSEIALPSNAGDTGEDAGLAPAQGPSLSSPIDETSKSTQDGV